MTALKITPRKCKTGTFKLVEGENDSTTFLPLNENIGGQIGLDNKYKYKESKYLTKEVNMYTKMLESGNIITSIHENNR